MTILKKYLLYKFHIKNWEEPIYGVIENSNDEWILIKRIINDYLHDGYTLIRRKYIKNISRDENTVFKEKVLDAKGEIGGTIDMSIDTIYTPLQWLMEQKKTFMISSKDENIGYVGYIVKLLKISFYLKSLDSNGVWREKSFLYEIHKIRTIDFEIDYINSLLAYNLKYLSDKD